MVKHETSGTPRSGLSRFRKRLIGYGREAAALVAHSGLDIQRLISLRHAPRFVADTRKFRHQGGTIDTLLPILYDLDDLSGSIDAHYFHQDLLVAQWVFNDSPGRHIDIGSRIDGFVSHVAAFRHIEVVDIRDAPPVNCNGITFHKFDVMSDDLTSLERADSVSCLHALEHFGLGRYGDLIDPGGYLRGFAAIESLVEPGGSLYVSVPVGVPQTVFNAHRIFDAADPPTWTKRNAQLREFALVDDKGQLIETADLEQARTCRYGCGIYRFEIPE